VYAHVTVARWYDFSLRASLVEHVRAVYTARVVLPRFISSLAVVVEDTSYAAVDLIKRRRKVVHIKCRTRESRTLFECGRLSEPNTRLRTTTRGLRSAAIDLRVVLVVNGRSLC